MNEINLTNNESLVKSDDKTTTDEYFVCPAVDIFETEDGLTLIADLPGLDGKNLQLSIDEGLLTIEGRAPVDTGDLLYREFSMSGYRRQFQLPDTLDTEKSHAEIKHGVLTLNLPKSEAAKPKRIEVSVH